MDGKINQPHENECKELAKQVGVSVEHFITLLDSANHAYNLIKKLGPFYGREDMIEPTFRITAEPVHLPLGSKKQLIALGQDLVHLGRALQKLPEDQKEILGPSLNYNTPITFRIDAIIDTNNQIKLNEIEGVDGVSALMMIEQLAYRLQSIEETTVSQFITALRGLFPNKPTLLIAILRTNLHHNLFTPNALRFTEFVKELSKDTIQCNLYDVDELKNGFVTPDWSTFDGILNESYCSGKELSLVGMPKDKLLSDGNFNAIVNKGVFALLFDLSLQDFWITHLGYDRFWRLTNLFIPSHFIYTPQQLDKARKEQKVVKVTWAGSNSSVINRAQGVAMPVGDIDESQEERWQLLHEYLQQGYKIIAQDFVEPKQISAFLRKRGTTLESVQWYNRLCVKYVVIGDPHAEIAPSVALTAMEVTLGPDIIPAGRKCSFTAGTFI